MRKRLLGVLCLLGVVLALSLSGCGDTSAIFNHGNNNQVNLSLDSWVMLNDIQVSVQIPPEVKVNHPFTITASISGSGPLTSLTASDGQDLGGNPSAHLQGESLADILRPPSTGSYSLCLVVDLHFDNDADFDLSKYATEYTTEQEFMLVPDVTTAETAQWTATPRDTFDHEVAHQARLRVWFDAETTCRVGTPSLLDDEFYLANGAAPATITVVN